MGPWSFRLSEDAVTRRLARVPGGGMPAARHHLAGDLYVRFETAPETGPTALIGKLLGHSHISTTSRYAHLADDPLKAAADRISERVAMTLAPGLVTDAPPAPHG